ncbi:hypothetical protein GGS23DRAFT_597354 [Durotheca rogersii]|uniref:uncharacterized protein n=1 Tax=Durotheca rogersii TaxID=419775 RepID=UPI00221F6A93|nr:uncharacterized protein GGS23DRAFT_597354 [Durotheca rogersii]KAI5862556.1 hypothetical protein GGS23DRAFT_597354 [Durotheca rogersii]
MASDSIPNIDFSASTSPDGAVRDALVQQLRAACESHGFFELTGHGVPQSLLGEVPEQSEKLFALPLEVKEKHNEADEPGARPGPDLSLCGRRYERLRSQNFEKRTAGDLKEGFDLGGDLASDHLSRFRRVVDEYFAAMLDLSKRVLARAQMDAATVVA